MLRKIAKVIMTCACAGLFGGCSADWLLNHEADEKSNADNTLKPSPFGIIGETPIRNQRPAIGDGGTSDRTKDVVTEPAYQDITITDDNLPKTGSGDGLSRVEEKSGADFSQVFPNRNPNERLRIDLDADNLNVMTIVARFAGDMKFNYTVETGVSGTVSMSLHAEFSAVEAWELFNHLLWMCNAYCDFRDGVLYIRPLNQVARERQILEEGSSVMLRTVRMKYVPATNIMEQLKPFLSNEATCKVLGQNNSLLLIDTPANINRVLEIIAELDKNYKQGWYRVVMQCNQVSSRKIVGELKQIMPVLGFAVTDVGNVDSQPGAIHLVSLDRLQVLIASASAIEPLVELRSWVNILNRTDAEEKNNAYIYKVVNGDAEQLLAEFSVLFPNMVGIVIPSKGGNVKNVNGVAAPNTDKVVAAPNSVFEYPVRISANLEYNRLVIMTTQRVYGIIRALLDRLDSIPPQVMLQVMVVEIELTDKNSFGVEWNTQTTVNGEKMNFGTDYSDLKPGADNQFGGNIHVFDPNNPNEKFLYVKALAGKSKLNVISSPQIMARSQYKSTVNVGKKVPIINSQLTDTSSSTGTNTSLVQNYKYEDTGIILDVTPTISEGGLISLQISQTISDALANTLGGVSTPIIKQDLLSTNLSLRSGSTIVMGGLIRDRKEESLDSIPMISEIPMLNWLVGNSSRSTERTEILVLITATAVNERTSLEEMIRRYSDSLREINVFENNVYKPYQTRRGEFSDRGGVIVKPSDATPDEQMRTDLLEYMKPQEATEADGDTFAPTPIADVVADAPESTAENAPEADADKPEAGFVPAAEGE